MNYISLFTGIGGFDLALDRCGFNNILQVEKDKFCLDLLLKKWPNVPKVNDVRQIEDIAVYGEQNQVYGDSGILCGGDPCQSRSLAKGNKRSAHPDMSGYFLLLAQRLRPRWIIRENVPAPDVCHFTGGLGLFGYRPLVIELQAADFTAQNRRRQFVVGRLGVSAAKKSVSAYRDFLPAGQTDIP